MERIERNMGDIGADERQLYESVLGHKLGDDQRVVIQVIDSESPASPLGATVDDYAIFRDLSDEQIAELESAILERLPGRDIDV